VSWPPAAERRARWVLESIGAHDADVHAFEYRADAWAEVERCEPPKGDELADAFFHLARVEELRGPRDAHGRFPAAASTLDPLDPPLERLRAHLGGKSPRIRGARFAVALTHDVDTPWRWTRIGIRGAAARLKSHALAGRGRAALREARALSHVPAHRLRRTDPNWSFERVTSIERAYGASSTFFVMAGHRHAADGAAPEAYERLRPRLVETLRSNGAEVALHGSYTAAEDAEVLAAEKTELERLAGPVWGQRYHYLRVDPHRNLAPLDRLGFGYDSSLGFAGAPGFRAGIATPFRPWDVERDRPLELVEIPLAVMDATFEERYLGLSARQAEPHVRRVLEYAAEQGGGFAILWHTDRFDAASAERWDELYERTLAAVSELGGICLSAGELAEEALPFLR
jgi:peptidoglycan/xylan/chitin deacetylase (PgdA/CDA1 family)